MILPRQSVHVESPTERRNPRTADIDTLPTLEVLQRVNAEDLLVPGAVHAALPQLARAVDLAVAALSGGGRVHYVGAGTSGRLATLDAAELRPTYDVPDGWFVVHHAGGDRALRNAVEDAEDDERAGSEAMVAVRPGDFVLGLTASGRTPFVLGALAAARERGAATALVSNNPDAPQPPGVDVLVAVDTGPEAISGSTRMKAGTSQKIILTSFSTAVMVRMGRTFGNLMVSMRATNAKLRGRTLRILREATGMGQQECSTALTEAHGDLKTALVHLLSGAEVRVAAEALRHSDGHVRAALGMLNAHAAS